MEFLALDGMEIPYYRYDAVIVGSGAAALNAADTLLRIGRQKICLITERMNCGTSRNAGSDKQTYYKLALASGEPDSVAKMAETLFSGGSVDGDTALCEAAGSVRGFMKLVQLGVPFPTNEFGEYVGYKTDHDPCRRGSSAGPLTSKLMTEALEKSVRERGLEIFDGYTAFRILRNDSGVQGVLTVRNDEISRGDPALCVFLAPNVVAATGGPACVYHDSVYPLGQTGMTGMLLEVGAEASNLQEWQYGLASTDFRWNVSGTYQQVLPRYLSVDADGTEHEFLPDYYETPEEALNQVFLKGYQWPFDAAKVDGSSRIDLILHHERKHLGRRVYMDFTCDPKGLENGFKGISDTAYSYLKQSGALVRTPIERLRIMNQKAIEIYREHGIDLAHDRLEVAVCAQHCNGGIHVDINWQSSVPGLYVVGEAAGTFGVCRPGGSALNSGQVGAQRAAEHIVGQRRQIPMPGDVAPQVTEVLRRLLGIREGDGTLQRDRMDFRERMSADAAFIRSREKLCTAEADVAATIWRFFETAELCRWEQGLVPLLRQYDCLLTQAAVLSAMNVSLKHGSRGSGLVLRKENRILELEDRFEPEHLEYRGQIVRTRWTGKKFRSDHIPVRPIPVSNQWFEHAYNRTSNE